MINFTHHFESMAFCGNFKELPWYIRVYFYVMLYGSWIISDPIWCWDEIFPVKEKKEKKEEYIEQRNPEDYDWS